MNTTQKLLSLALSVSLLSTSIISSSAFAAAFQDTYGHWAQQDIQALSDQSIIGGYPDGTFHPEGLITRAEFSAILVKALGLQAGYSNGNSFRDVPGSHWAAPAIQAVQNQGLVSGYPGNLFMPNKNITRAEAMAMLAKASQAPSPDATTANTLLGQYYDSHQVPNWGRPAVAETIQAGIFENRPNSPGAIEPNRMITRAEVAAMVANLRSGGQPPQNVAQNPQQQQQGQYQQGNNYNNGMLQGRIAVVPANTQFTGTLQRSVGSETARVGDQVVLTIDQPLASQNNFVVVPNGSQVLGRVVSVEPAGRLSDSGELQIDFNEVILPNGQRFQLQATINTENGVLKGDSTKGRILKAAGKTALGAGLGALAGTAIAPLSGGKVGKGAIYGTAIGAGAGLTTAAVQKGKEVELSAGDRLEIILKQPLSVNMPQ